MQWERDEAWFMGVSLIVRLVSPRNSCRRTIVGGSKGWVGLHQLSVPSLTGSVVQQLLHKHPIVTSQLLSRSREAATHMQARPAQSPHIPTHARCGSGANTCVAPPLVRRTT